MYDQAYCYKITEQLKNLDKRLTRIQVVEERGHLDNARKLYENLERKLHLQNEGVSDNIPRIIPLTMKNYLIIAQKIKEDIIQGYQGIREKKQKKWTEIH